MLSAHGITSPVASSGEASARSDGSMTYLIEKRAKQRHVQLSVHPQGAEELVWLWQQLCEGFPSL